MKFEEIPFKDLLSNIIDNRGKTCPTVEDGIPLIATNCVNNKTLYPTFDKIRFVSQKTYDKWFRGHPEPGDILFVTKGSPGRCNFVPNPINFCIAQDMVSIRADESKIDPKFLFALLRSPQVQNQIGNMHVGTLIPHFKKGDFDKLILEIPTDSEYQKKVGEIYFTFSEKIHLNKQINETLEAMAQAIYKNWFVDFDPVRAKINATSAGRDPNRVAMAAITGITLNQDWNEIEVALDQKLSSMSEAQQQQLTHTAKLFPDELVESEIGEVPKGWEVKKLHDVSELNPESISTDYEGEIEYINISGVNTGVINETELYSFNDAPSRARRIVKHGDMIWSNVRPNLKAYSLILNPPSNLIASTGFTVIRPKQLPASYIYNHCISEEFISFLINSTEGSAYPAVKVTDFKRSNIVFPANNLANIFHEVIWDNFERIDVLKKENKLLSELRDTLLPKFISGDIELT